MSETNLWYLAKGQEALGPYSFNEVKQLLDHKTIAWIDYLWAEGQADWMRACDIPEFQKLLTPPPKRIVAGMPVISESQTKPTLASEVREWFCFLNEVQTGPYTHTELVLHLRSTSQPHTAFLWKQGFPDWKRVDSIEEFSKFIKADFDKTVERRKHIRVPVMAKVRIVANPDSIKEARYATALARDLSIGGMQVLTDVIPGAPGTKLKVLLCPLDDSANAQVPFQPIQASGEVVRTLDHEKGFCFRFERLSPEVEKAIQHLVELSR